MMNLAGKNPRDVFPFLDERSAIEPFLYETLLEIDQQQRNFIAGKTSSLATRELLKASRNIKIPFTIARDKNSIVRNQVHPTDEFCFHSSNYDHIKRSLDVKKIIPIIGVRIDVVKQKLKAYGIMSADFSDYRDTKVDYILNILMEIIPSSLSQKELCEVKNFHSLRECVLKVDKLLDPARIYGADIVKVIRESGIISARDICAALSGVTNDTLAAWSTKENMDRESVMMYSAENGTEWFFDIKKYVTLFESVFEGMRSDPVKFAALPQFEKDSVKTKLSAFNSSAGLIVSGKNVPAEIKSDADELKRLQYVMDEYQNYMKQKELRTEVSSGSSEKKSGFFSAIAGLLKGIFSIFSKSPKETRETSQNAQVSSGKNAPISKETRMLYSKASASKGPVLALSDFIELTRENDVVVDKIINDMRKNNLKIVMPVYNARTSLYPKRSAKLLMPDIEYLLVPVEAIRTPEAITDYVDSLVGFKMKDDVMSGSMLIQIEKYLRTVQRQRKHMKKEASGAS